VALHLAQRLAHRRRHGGETGFTPRLRVHGLYLRQSRADLKPALTHLETVVGVLNKNEDNIDNSLRLMAPFYRVFANTLGNGPWFDTFIQNIPPVPKVG
jgi:phospholipid/cholesterol/gamma-HCH transport system substrate-binding protein